MADVHTYRWKDHIPLTSDDARRAFSKGVQVICLHPTRESKPVTSEADIRRHARKGGIFAAVRKTLKTAETTYLMEYRIVHPVSGPAMAMATPEDGIKLTVESDDRFSLFENGQANLSALAKQYDCPDGEYWVEITGYSKAFGKMPCTDYDEGVVTIKGGEVIKVPANFWLPF